MRTVKEPDVRKQEILDGAIKLFSQKGCGKTTTTDIARALKISQGLCCRCFPTKEAVYDAAAGTIYGAIRPIYFRIINE